MKTQPINPTLRPGFSLIELLAVVAIILTLAALVVGGVSFMGERKAKESAKVQIGMLERAIEEYKLDMGKYPGDGDGSIGGTMGTAASGELYKKLFYEGYEFSVNPGRVNTGNEPKATKIYLPQLDPRNSKVGWVESVTSEEPPEITAIIDPWRNEYRYRRPPLDTSATSRAINPDFDLWSIGKDGATSSNPKDAKSKDDIRNF